MIYTAAVRDALESTLIIEVQLSLANSHNHFTVVCLVRKGQCVSDLTKYCVHLFGERGAGSSKRWFLHFKYVVYRAVLAVGVCILYNSGDFAILYLYYWKLMYVFDFVCFIPQSCRLSCQSLGLVAIPSVCLSHLLWDTTLHLYTHYSSVN